jgi:hypothetical protein
VNVTDSDPVLGFLFHLSFLTCVYSRICFDCVPYFLNCFDCVPDMLSRSKFGTLDNMDSWPVLDAFTSVSGK